VHELRRLYRSWKKKRENNQATLAIYTLGIKEDIVNESVAYTCKRCDKGKKGT
jgi:hypothetical protein